MRDPLGSITLEPTKVRRNLYQALPHDHFLHDEASTKMVAAGQLVPFQFVTDKEIISPRIPFVSYPHEWCDAQLLDAAELTLTLSEDALSVGHELKDASAWNVIFDGCKPLFCDHLSFQKISEKRWWAFAQYIRHFVLPLCLAKYRLLNAKDSFKINRDGIDPDLARSLMGLKRFATRYWMLMLKPRGSVIEKKSTESYNNSSYHKNLYKTTRWFLGGVRNVHQQRSVWNNYTEERDHYTDSASDVKFQTVKTWLVRLSPQWVIDLGCNTGEFSKLAASAGSRVVAIDLDHESVQKLYLANKGEQIYPVIANLEDLSGGRGWGGDEFPGLLTRLDNFGDLVLMLAVVHHLAISSSVPYDRIAEIAASLTKRYLIIELLDSTDPLTQHLAAQRNRQASEFSLSAQRAAFDRHFNTVEIISIPDSSRQLFLMEKK